MSFELVPNFKTLGPRLGESVKYLKPALAAMDGVEAAKILESGNSLSVELPGETISLSGDDVELRVKSQEGFSVSREGGEVIALDLTLNDELIRRGLVRDVIRQVQELRKSNNFELSDRISLHLLGLDDLSQDDLDLLSHEVLATTITVGAGSGEGQLIELDDREDVRAWLTLA